MSFKKSWGFIAALGSFVMAANAPAGTNAFTQLGPEGGRVLHVQFHPANPSIAYLAAPSFYRSTDAGITWQAPSGFSTETVYDFAVDPNDSDRLFLAAINTALLVSSDAGATLTRLTSFPQSGYGPSNVEISRDGTLYVTANKKVFRSTDGTTWTERAELADTIQPNSLRVDPLDSNVLYLFKGATGYKSTDGAASWQPLSFPSAVYDLIVLPVTPRLLFAATPSSGIIVSSNGGATWTSAGLADVSTALTVDPANPSILYAGTTSGLFKTTNQGGSWSNVHGNARTGDITSIAVSATQASLVLAGGEEGLARSTTGGSTWTRANNGFIASGVDKFVPIPGSNRIYLNTYAMGVFLLDAGSTWAQPVNPDGLDALKNPRVNLESFDLLAQGPSPDRLFVGMNGGFARSIDGGANWQWFNNTMGLGAVTSFSSHPSQPDVILASAAPGLHRSVDAGLTWGNVNGLPATGEATAMKFAPSSPSVAYTGVIEWPFPGDPYAARGIYKSINGGLDWTAANNGLSDSYVIDIAVHPLMDGTVYAATNTGLFKTVNGGASWTLLNWSLGSQSGVIVRIAIDPIHPDIVYAMQSSYIGRSIDGGFTWENVTTQLGVSRVNDALTPHPFKEHTILASLAGAVEMTLATDVEIEARLPSSISYGSSPTIFEYTVRNLGPLHATDLRTVIQMPASAQNIAASTTAGTCSVAGTKITCEQPSLLAGRAALITVNSTYNAPADLEVVAIVRSSEPDIRTSNNSVRSAVRVLETSDISVAATAPASGIQGEPIVYSIEVTNSGPDSATGVALNIQFTHELAISSVTSSKGSCSSTSSGAIDCAFGSLPSSSKGTISVIATSISAGVHTATATATCLGTDPNVPNNTASANTTVTTSPTGGGTGGSSTGNGTTGSGSVTAPSPASNGESNGGGGSVSYLLLALLFFLSLWRRPEWRRR